MKDRLADLKYWSDEELRTAVIFLTAWDPALTHEATWGRIYDPFPRMEPHPRTDFLGLQE